MDLRGQRFTVDLSDDESESPSTSNIRASAVPSVSSAFIGDIKERVVRPPSAPQLKTTASGFPEHKKRTRVSAFKAQRTGVPAQTAPESGNAYSVPPRATPTPSTQRQDDTKTEKERIDLENKQKMAAMSPEEIEEERRELFASLDPSLIERFLRRANLDEGRGDTGIEPPAAISGVKESQPSPNPDEKDNKGVVGGEASEGVPAPVSTGKRVKASKTVTFEGEEEPEDHTNVQSASHTHKFDDSELPEGSVHFPQAPASRDLDPNDPDFLENLHSKYFPDLPADPTKLAWMAPIPTSGSIADQESPYYPGQQTLASSALRFDFRGGILPPRIARAMPTTKGLHHHGEAPEAAGYTVPELARLARSAYPAQRCIAFQTLGRLLYRLGRGEWGASDSDIVQGLWKCVADGGVVQTLQEAAGAEGGHQGSKVYATEAVWLWQKGGGKPWVAQ